MLLTVWTLGDEIWEKPQSGSTRDLKNGDLTAGQDQRTDLRTGSLCKSYNQFHIGFIYLFTD